MGSWRDQHGHKQPKQAFAFPPPVCAACPLRPACIQAKSKRGRTVHLHPQEGLLQAARAFQHSPAFAPYRAMRQTAEHRLARLVQLGIRQARYVGRQKTLFQVLMADTVSNLTSIATKTGKMLTKRGRFLGSSTWLEALREAIRAIGGKNGHRVHVFQRRLSAADSKMPVFGQASRVLFHG